METGKFPTANGCPQPETISDARAIRGEDRALRPILPEYRSIKPDEYQADAISQYRSKIESIAFELKSTHYPKNPRYLAIALTKLEEASMFITKAITHNKEH